MTCKECANRPKLGKPKDEQYYVDIIDSMAERTNRRSHILNLILCGIVALLVVVCVFLVNKMNRLEQQLIEMENEFETIETYEDEYHIEQDASDGGRNYIVGGDYNGSSESDD